MKTKLAVDFADLLYKAEVPEVLVLGVVGLPADLQGHVVGLGVVDLLVTPGGRDGGRCDRPLHDDGRQV